MLRCTVAAKHQASHTDAGQQKRRPGPAAAGSSDQQMPSVRFNDQTQGWL